MTLEELWQAVLAQIQLTISPANFTTWFKNTSIVSLKDGEATISTPNSFVKEWLEQKYNKQVFKTLRELNEEIKNIRFFIQKTETKAPKREFFMPETSQLEFTEFKTDKETNLNPRYTFENFTVGPFNELPHAAGFAVSKNPGAAYNPLFIYGGVGLGKTHLLQAIGNELIKNFPQKKVRYVSSEKITSEIVAGIRNQEIENLKNKYKQIDVLIVDDVQFLAGKEKTQEEFFHIFNALYEKNKQIILSSDNPPKSIPSLAERLRSRFEGGMVADIGLPELETRLAILKNKSQERGAELTEEVLNFVAVNVPRNIRELEGALNRLMAYQKIQTQPLSVEVAKSLLKNLIFAPNKIINAKKIIQGVAEFYDLRDKDLLLESRKKEIVGPRQVAMYLIREEMKGSFPFIGRKFGGKDHTTAIHAYRKIAKEMEKNEGLTEEISLIRQKIYSA
ncbi:MAG: chromosomal replication initiator protein DnaA [Candidatus Nealsonbacteria bacterium]|nr:chromosomal replication initiator protein DnaA [Candidatus Nealsonbacteria bacterium]